jgi:hypothetical protein
MKSTMTKLMLVLAFGWVVFGSALAGDLEPPGPPAPTMVTLQDIYDACTGGAACGVPQTGQTGCWDAAGTPIDCTGTGQDGEYQAGVSVAPRFADNGDGTVTDNLTGLIWLQNANCFGLRDWTNALSDANTLADPACGLTDGSVAGDWRLPNLRELQSLIDYQNNTPALPSGHPFSGVQSGFYWSSTAFVNGPDRAWSVYLSYGGVDHFDKAGTYYVWPVRGGE